MKNEKYLWVAFFIVVIVVALYLRFYGEPSYQLSVSFNTSIMSNGTIYPYQNVRIPITVTNVGGSALSGINLGLYINGSTQNIYKLDVPVGKSIVIPFNYTPKAPGTYNVSVIADPGKVFALTNRNSAQAEATFTVSNSQPPSPYMYIGENGLLSGSYADLGNSGVVAELFLYSNYSFEPLALSNITSLNNFMYPLITIAGPYVEELAYANGVYNRGKISSIWIRSYLEPYIFSYASSYKSLKTENLTVNGTRVTLIKLDNYSEMCSWYSGGWIKIIATNGSENCTSVLGSPPAGHYSPLNGGIAFAANSAAANALSLGNYSAFSGNAFTSGKLIEFNDSVNYVQRATNMTNPFLVCYGAIYNISGESYCSTYTISVSGKIGRFSLIGTRLYLNTTNVTDFSLVNTSRILFGVTGAISTIQGIGATGESLRFLPGIANSCGFTQHFNCTGAVFENSTLKFRLINRYNQSVRITRGDCFISYPSNVLALNYTLEPLGSANVSIGCYYNGTRIIGVPFNLYLGIGMNYTVGGYNGVALGSAYIV